MTDAHYTRLDPADWEGEDVHFCLGYWNELRGDRLAPNWKDFDWSEIPPTLIPYFAVVDVTLNPDTVTYRFFGTAHSRAHGLDLTGQSPLEFDPLDVGQSMFSQYIEVARAKEPAFYLHILHQHGMDSKIQETSLRLPFSNNGKTISQIAAFTDLRKDFEQARKHFVYDRE